MFTTLDGKDGFDKIKLDDDSSKLTTFWMPFGRYRYLRIPFGICSAPEEFESTLHEQLGDLEGVEVLRDDMLVVGYGDTQDEANRNDDENLPCLLKRAREINLKFNKKKLNLRRSEVKFIGHVLTCDGLKPDADKVKVAAEMPRPTTKQETLSLLGFVNYLAKFLPSLSEVAQPLRELTTKNARFVWSSQHYKSFTEVKKLVSAHRYSNTTTWMQKLRFNATQAKKAWALLYYRMANQSPLCLEHLHLSSSVTLKLRRSAWQLSLPAPSSANTLHTENSSL